MRKFVLFLGALLFAAAAYALESGPAKEAYDLKAWTEKAALADTAVKTLQAALNKAAKDKLDLFTSTLNECRTALQKAEEQCTVHKAATQTEKTAKEKVAETCVATQARLAATEAELKAATERFTALVTSLGKAQEAVATTIGGYKVSSGEAGPAAGGDQPSAGEGEGEEQS